MLALPEPSIREEIDLIYEGIETLSGGLVFTYGRPEEIDLIYEGIETILIQSVGGNLHFDRKKLT